METAILTMRRCIATLKRNNILQPMLESISTKQRQHHPDQDTAERSTPSCTISQSGLMSRNRLTTLIILSAT